MSNETVTTTDQTDPQTTDPTPDLGTIDRIIEWMRSEVARARQEFAADGYQPGYYSAAFELTDIAKALGLSYRAVNGCCTHMHRTGRIIGLRLVGACHPPKAYSIMLREGVGEVQA